MQPAVQQLRTFIATKLWRGGASAPTSAKAHSYVALSAVTMTLTPAPPCLTPVLSEVIIKILWVEVGV
jgi:hypothetical protein